MVGVDSTKGGNHVLLAGFREHIIVYTDIILISIMAVNVVGGIQTVDYSPTDYTQKEIDVSLWRMTNKQAR